MRILNACVLDNPEFTVSCTSSLTFKYVFFLSGIECIALIFFIIVLNGAVKVGCYW
jgi:hypothetical protein